MEVLDTVHRRTATAPGPSAPPVPADEARRLEALRRYCVLDTPPEPAFDRIANLGRALFDTPAAMVSLVDETRQWFKARPGLDLSETRRDWAFCAYTILSDEPLVVPDALRDPLFADNPLVTGGPRVRFYAGAPIVTGDGLRLGSVCVASPRPRPAAVREDDLARLKDLAAIAMDLLELRLRARALADAVAERDEALRGAAALLDGDDRRRVLERLDGPAAFKATAPCAAVPRPRAANGTGRSR